MNQELLDKLRREASFYKVKGDNIMEEVEKKRLSVLEQEYHIKSIRRDLDRSNAILEELNYDDR